MPENAMIGVVEESFEDGIAESSYTPEFMLLDFLMGIRI